MIAPFPYFGGKRTVAAEVWARFGKPKQYIEPFCGSAAVLLHAEAPISLEVIGDANGFIANFWRAVVHQSDEVARWADYPVSHVDLGARHGWLLQQRVRLGCELLDPNWPGDAKVAGWWLWGQCAWIGSGWCDWSSKIPHVSNAGRGIQAIGPIPHVSNAGMGIQAIGPIPHVSNAGMGTWTSGGETALRLLSKIAARMERVRVIHGAWDRCLNHHYGGDDTAVFLDPPYENYETLYSAGTGGGVVQDVVAWCRDNENLRIALCGHSGDYDLPGWTAFTWSRGRFTYSGKSTTDNECIWFSPSCIEDKVQLRMW